MDSIEKGLKQLHFYEYAKEVEKSSRWEEGLYCLLDYINKVHYYTDIKITQREIQKEIRDMINYYNSAEDKNLWLNDIELELRKIWANISLEPIHKSFIWLDIIYDDEYCNTKVWKDIIKLFDNKGQIIDISLPIFALLKNKYKKNNLDHALEINFLNKPVETIDYRKVGKLYNHTWFLIPMYESIRNDRIVDKLLSE